MQMFNLMSSICVDLTCQVRKRDFNLFKEHGNIDRQKVEEA